MKTIRKSNYAKHVDIYIFIATLKTRQIFYSSFENLFSEAHKRAAPQSVLLFIVE